MLAIALTMLSYKSYCQNNQNIKLSVINNDTVFIFNKVYANYLVSKFDSLKHYKISFNVCADVLTDCAKLRDNYKLLSTQKDSLIDNLQKQVLYCEGISESYHKSEILNKQLQKDLKRQLRKTKVWNGIGWGAITATVITSLILILK
jgi:Zn-finger domain-containing protein